MVFMNIKNILVMIFYPACLIMIVSLLFVAMMQKDVIAANDSNIQLLSAEHVLRLNRYLCYLADESKDCDIKTTITHDLRLKLLFLRIEYNKSSSPEVVSEILRPPSYPKNHL